MEANRKFLEKCRAQRKFADDQKAKFLSDESEKLIQPILDQIDAASKRGEDRIRAVVKCSLEVACNLQAKLRARFDLKCAKDIHTDAAIQLCKFDIWGW